MEKIVNFDKIFNLDLLNGWKVFPLIFLFFLLPGFRWEPFPLQNLDREIKQLIINEQPLKKKTQFPLTRTKHKIHHVSLMLMLMLIIFCLLRNVIYHEDFLLDSSHFLHSILPFIFFNCSELVVHHSKDKHFEVY